MDKRFRIASRFENIDISTLQTATSFSFSQSVIAVLCSDEWIQNNRFYPIQLNTSYNININLFRAITLPSYHIHHISLLQYIQ